MYEQTKFLMAGEKAVVVEFGNEISETINQKVRAMMIATKKMNIDGMIELIPTYRSLMVQYDPCKIDYETLLMKLQSIEKQLNEIDIPLPKVIEIPTLYGNEYGPDIQNVANHNHLSIEEVVNIHSSKEYLIYMLGFTPGFPYLGGMDEKIATPRLKEPRTKITGGSVGIAGSQTGIYPIDSPGGWQLIGRTPLKLYDAYRKEPILLEAGNYIKFVPINEEKYKKIEDEIKHNTYEYKIYSKERNESI
ncbi:5-oxoprolinase subunit PxpB [Inediibacterium massiliense]|uniref:5-oxoprolinase subunit PxpB n=1 Tax=Inediibacterium massiliense TaxID=1658111 RepID=UPI0006B45532|nr:5-oxoprolinase subunit PxpB [Inediibacterium massiliense]